MCNVSRTVLGVIAVIAIVLLVLGLATDIGLLRWALRDHPRRLRRRGPGHEPPRYRLASRCAARKAALPLLEERPRVQRRPARREREPECSRAQAAIPGMEGLLLAKAALTLVAPEFTLAACWAIDPNLERVIVLVAATDVRAPATRVLVGHCAALETLKPRRGNGRRRMSPVGHEPPLRPRDTESESFVTDATTDRRERPDQRCRKKSLFA